MEFANKTKKDHASWSILLLPYLVYILYVLHTNSNMEVKRRSCLGDERCTISFRNTNATCCMTPSDPASLSNVELNNKIKYLSNNSPMLPEAGGQDHLVTCHGPPSHGNPNLTETYKDINNQHVCCNLQKWPCRIYDSHPTSFPNFFTKMQYFLHATLTPPGPRFPINCFVSGG